MINSYGITPPFEITTYRREECDSPWAPAFFRAGWRPTNGPLGDGYPEGYFIHEVSVLLPDRDIGSPGYATHLSIADGPSFELFGGACDLISTGGTNLWQGSYKTGAFFYR